MNVLGEHGGLSKQLYSAHATIIIFNYLKELNKVRKQFGYKRLEEEPYGEEDKKKEEKKKEEKKKKEKVKEDEKKSRKDAYAEVYVKQ